MPLLENTFYINGHDNSFLRYVWSMNFQIFSTYVLRTQVMRYLNSYKFTSNRLYDDEFNLLSQNMSKLTNAYRSWQQHERECESKRNGIEKNSDSKNIWFLFFHSLSFWRVLSSSHFLWSDSLVQFAVYAFIWSHEIVGRTTNFTTQNNILRNLIVSKLHFYSHLSSLTSKMIFV